MKIWDGIYKSFQHTPQQGEIYYGSPLWAQRAKKRLQEKVNASKFPGTIPKSTSYKESLLPFLVALSQQKKKKIQITDFGGGLGWEYIAVRDAQTGTINIQYDIIETEAICREGKKQWKSNKSVRFFPILPTKKYHTDIVHIGSSLQYINDWRQTLKTFVSYTPSYILFTDLPAGDIPTFVTTQVFYGSFMPYRFYNIADVCRYLRSLGYALIFKSRFISNIRGKEQEYPQENFPKKYRLGDSCNLLFTPI